MDAAKLAADYAAQHRAEYGDDDIRAALIAQGFPKDAVEEGLRRAGPRAAIPVAAPAGRSLLKKILIGGAVAVGCAALALAGFVGYVVKNRKARPALPAELANFKPAPLADPAHLAAYLPAGLEDADAGEDYARIVAGRVGMMQEPGGHDRLKAGLPLSASERKLLDSALRKSRNALYGTHIAPASLNEFVLHVGAMAGVLMEVTKTLRAESKAASDRGDWAEAEAISRRLTLFGWHMTQDWDTATQLLGATIITGGVLEQNVAKAKARGQAKIVDLDASRAMLELAAYLPDKKILGAIIEEMVEPGRMPEAAQRLRDPRARRAYAAWTLSFAAVGLSSGEAEAAAASPERVAFFDEMSRDPDPRMARLGESFGRLMRSIEADYRSTPQKDRRAVRKALAQKLTGVSRMGN